MDLHHVGDKEFEIGNAINLGVGLERLARELEKCVVLCANCHRKEHRPALA